MPSDIRGYFVLNNAASVDLEYIRCDGTTCKKITTPNTSVTTCSNIGDLVLNESKIKICISSTKMVEFSSSEKYSTYLIENNGNTIFSDDITNEKILLSISNNFIIPLDSNDCMLIIKINIIVIILIHI
ncbi:hypothetical protein BCR32DRAFT_242221 [Anaeromyces robustus]|uniref:Uncharacterized protein n=1 Tax=Anaeromyces robustus TaxID=1754192 RepID=A0A1Y1XGJ8_9FUNG|nr:hypothetical protein BCR32DRAFT_242221 [Anaeromyces robustus]|eukprot:ORX84880.1 hypothetical protein BCR32DRAFT_242221 [Anaeromyces robustus]